MNSQQEKAPRSAPASQEHQDAQLFDMLELLVDEGTLDALSLVRLGRCSKSSKSTAAALLVKRTAFLLPAAVQQAAQVEDACGITKDRHIRIAKMLLGGAASEGVASSLAAPTASKQFLSIGNVPLVLAEQLLTVGLRFNYDQLMQAVRARTARVDVWVLAMAAQPAVVKTALQAGLPPWVERLCCDPCSLVSML
jgi:hypothetical protein